MPTCRPTPDAQFINTRMHEYTHECMQVSAWTHNHTYTYKHTGIHTNNRTCIHTYIHTSTLECLLKIKGGTFNLPPFQVVRFMKKKFCKKFGCNRRIFRCCPRGSKFEECGPIVYNCFS